MNRNHWLVLGAIAAASAQAVACSSEFTSCADTRTCPGGGASGTGEGGEAGEPDDAEAGRTSSTGGRAGGAGKGGFAGTGPEDIAGAAGVAGEAGAAGAPPSVECRDSSECSDKLACNGIEQCKEGVCVAGTPACANPDPGNCDAVCTENSGAASCAVRGRDGDKDGHFSSACAASPGDDCNDSAPTVFTGAPELCDGLDNNCNNKSDLSDGLGAGGTSVAIGNGYAAIAWSPEVSRYGIVLEDQPSANAADMYFEEVDASGAITLAPKLINDAATRLERGVDITWGGDSFGVTWAAPNGVHMRTITGNGVVASPLQVLSTTELLQEPKIARIAGGAWGVIYYRNEEGDNDFPRYVAGKTISASNVLSAQVQLTPKDAYTWDIAATAGNFVTATTEVSGTGFLTKGAVAPGLTGGVQFTISGRYPAVGTGPAGVAIAWSGSTDSTGPSFATLSATGTPICPATPFADPTFRPVAVVATPTGYLIVGGMPRLSPSVYVLKAQEVFSDCTLGPLFVVDPGPASSVNATGSSAGYGFTWYDQNAKVSKRRIIGPKYCN